MFCDNVFASVLFPIPLSPCTITIFKPRPMLVSWLLLVVVLLLLLLVLVVLVLVLVLVVSLVCDSEHAIIPLQS